MGLTWQTVSAFLRILTNPRLYHRPLEMGQLLPVVKSWLDRDNVALVTPGPRHWELLSRMLIDGQVTGPLVTDARPTALALEHTAIIHTHDLDFNRFPGIRVRYPLRGD